MTSPSPSPKTRWSRIVRRTSTVLSISRPTTPSIASDRDADTASLSGSIKGPALKAPPSLPTNPSPIAESPNREAAAVAQEAVGPSPLTQAATSSEEPPHVPATTLSPVEEAQSPTGYIPPPVIDSSVGNPGAFTDGPDELPQPDIAKDPYTVAAVEPPVESATVDTPEPVTVQPDVSEGPHAVTTVEPHVEPTTADAPEPVTVVPHTTRQYEPEPETTITGSLVEEPTSYFDEPATESVKDLGSADHVDNTTAISEAVQENVVASFPEPDYGHGEAAEYYGAVVVPTTREVVHENAKAVHPEPGVRQLEAKADNHNHVTAVPIEHEIREGTAEPTSMPAPVPNYEAPSYPMNLGSGQEVWGGEYEYGRKGLHHPYENAYSSSAPVIIPNPEDLKRERSPAPSVRMPEADPFADPIAPRITVSHSEIHMPQPEIPDEYDHGPTETHRDRDMHGPMVMPLPSFNTVASKPIRRPASSSSLRDADTGKFGMPVETDETLPLLTRPLTSNRHKPASYLQSSAQVSHPHSHNMVSVSPLVFSSSHSETSNGHANTWNPHPSSHPRLHSLGWIEYHLPDGTVYYVHPTSRVTTEINLRSERMLTGVERFLADHVKHQSGSSNVEAGEIWLRDVGTTKSGMVLERWWVDHMVRTVVMVGDEHEHGRKGSAKGKAKKGDVFVEEDQLDTEYRYWSFMEAHPAHNSLSPKAKIEAMDVLTWAWTERLLPSHRSVPAPFTQEECQELMTLIRSFGDDHHDDHGIQTRIVSRVLLRVAHWRQTYFRPNKALPANACSNSSRLPRAPRRPFRRAILDILVSCLFLGIPYMFFERARHSSRIDEESGLRNATPTLVIGACTCLVAAIVLSASVTFLSLPGLDSFSRTAGMVAILLAAFSMAATVVAIFRHKADLERPISHIGIEGIMVITRRTVILSLPLVFVAYSIIAFITAIILYSFRGVTLSDPSMTRKSFEDYTKWGAVGVVGALAGMVTTSVLLLKR